MILHNEPRESPLKSVVLRLGGFHMQMSFLGCIDIPCSRLGSSELLENIYASNTIEHMMSGKSVSRAVRGHSIIDCALYIMLLSKMIDVSLLGIEASTDENVNEVNAEDKEVIDTSSTEQINHPQSKYVLDGGSLLHRIQWPRGVTFGRIADLYVDHVCRKYNTAIVVFDGYENGPSTKDPTHQRRTKGIVGTKVLFKEDTPSNQRKNSS
ncbi:unnamed protein product [Mytilus edulis]|uniref:Uncharacterized protein n=1 Tax=Mytilus edulis TaxID=6550 RepID=A0A8S3UXD9_MYTED|nr:unnamed protein product [Mytilus edulis]